MRDSKLVIHESELLFKVIAERSERTSAMITTDLEFSKWPEMFKNATLVAALVDRLTYHSHILNMNGESYRSFLRSKWLRNSQPHGSVFRNHSGSKIHGHVVHFFIDIHTFESIDRFPTPKKTAFAVLFCFYFIIPKQERWCLCIFQR